MTIIKDSLLQASMTSGQIPATEKTADIQMITSKVAGTATENSTTALPLSLTWTGGSTNDSYSITTDFAITSVLR